jgi:hypothetical protein
VRSNPIDRLRCFRRTHREYFEDEEEKRRSASHPRRQKERKRLSNEDARKNFSLDVLLQKSQRRRGGKIRFQFSRKKLLSFSMICSRRRERVVVVFKARREREKKKSIIIVVVDGCVPPKKDPDPVLLARGRVGKACLCLFFESMCVGVKSSVAKFDDVFVSLLQKKKTLHTPPLNPTPRMFRVLVVQNRRS